MINLSYMSVHIWLQADPIILECPINQHNPRHWGRQCFPKPEFIREITTIGQGMWEQHERHPMGDIHTSMESLLV